MELPTVNYWPFNLLLNGSSMPSRCTHLHNMLSTLCVCVYVMVSVVLIFLFGTAVVHCSYRSCFRHRSTCLSHDHACATLTPSPTQGRCRLPRPLCACVCGDILAGIGQFRKHTLALEMVWPSQRNVNNLVWITNRSNNWTRNGSWLILVQR